MTLTTRSPPARAFEALEPEVRALLLELKRRLERRFGDRFLELWLFGSRARGDHEPDSDVDVVVVLDQAIPSSFELKFLILDDTYDLMLETGYYTQPWILEKTALANPDAGPRPGISRAVLRDGIRV